MELIISSGLAAVIVGGIFTLIQWKLNRKAAKEDRTDAVLVKLEEINKKLDNHIAANEKENADAARMRILRFADEVRLNVKHTEEHWNDILSQIDAYEDYCEAHSNYSNNKAVMAIELLKETYKELLRNKSFLS